MSLKNHQIQFRFRNINPMDVGVTLKGLSQKEKV